MCKYVKDCLTPDQLNYVKENYKFQSQKQMAVHLGIPFSRIQYTMMYYHLMPNSKRVKKELYLPKIEKTEIFFDVDDYFLKNLI